MTVTLDGDDQVIQLHRAAGQGEGPNPTLVASAPLDGPVGEPIYLRIDADRDSYDFLYGYDPDEMITLEDNLEDKILSTEESGGLVCVTIGELTLSDGDVAAVVQPTH